MSEHIALEIADKFDEMTERTALEIADRLKEIYYGKTGNEAADMLRQQHAEIERLRKAREIETNLYTKNMRYQDAKIERLQAALRASIETERSRCIAICISRIKPGTGSDAILRGAAREIQEGK